MELGEKGKSINAARKEQDHRAMLEIEISNNPHIDRIILSIDRSQYSVVICMASTYLL
jgi:hypothetical protein